MTPLLIPIEKKDDAKTIAKALGNPLLWDDYHFEWKFNGPPTEIPAELKGFFYACHPTLPQSTVLLLPLEKYQEEKRRVPEKEGTLRWDSNLTRAVWRGGKLPSRLQPYEPEPHTYEAFCSQAINQPAYAKQNAQKFKVNTAWPKAYSVGEVTLILCASHKKEEMVRGPLTGRGTILSYEEAQLLFPPTGEPKVREVLRNRITTLLVPEPPDKSYSSRAGITLHRLCKQIPNVLCILPDGSKTNPLQTYHCLPKLEEKYLREIPLENFPTVLKAFGLQARKKQMNIEWAPSSQDAIYIDTLLR